MGKYLLTTVDVALPWDVTPRKRGCDAVSPARASRRSGMTVLETSAAGYKKRPARFDENRSFTDEFQPIMNASPRLDDSTDRRTTKETLRESLRAGGVRT